MYFLLDKAFLCAMLNITARKHFKRGGDDMGTNWEETVNITVREIDQDAWKKFRGICIMEGKTIAEKLNDLLRQTVKEGE